MIGTTKRHFAIQVQLWGRGFKGHSDKVLFYYTLGKEVVRDGRDDFCVVRYECVKRQVIRSKTVEQVC